METNETLKAALIQATEQEIVKLVDQLQSLPKGDLKALEQSVLATSLAIGNRVLSEIVNDAGQQMGTSARREGECGHRQRLVGTRPKQLLTLMGKVTVYRAYYQCLVEEGEEDAGCSHGQTPFDEVWGIKEGRTSPGVQKLMGKLVARMTLSEAV